MFKFLVLLLHQQKSNVSEVLENFQEVFSDIPGRTESIERKVTLTSNVHIRSRSYTIQLHYWSAVQQEIIDMLHMGIIEESL